MQPGDRVDVIAQPPRSGSAPPKAVAILRGVRVLAIGDSLEYMSATPSPQEANAATVTLEVNPKQADLLVMADLNTTLRLALRSPKEPLNSQPTEPLHFDTAPNASAPASAPGSAVGAIADAALIKELAGNGNPRPAAGRQSNAPVPQGEPGSPVTVIDGDHYAGADAGAAPAAGAPRAMPQP